MAFLDQDDLWLPRKLEQQIALTSDARVGLIYGRALAFFPDGSQRDHDYFHEFEALPEGHIFEELLGRGCFITMSSSLLRASAVMEICPIPEEIKVTPDYYLYLAVCGQYETRAVQDVVCRYRMRSDSMTNVYRRESEEESLWLVERFGRHVPRKLYEKRRSHLATSVAFDQMRHSKSFRAGLRRLMRDGSPFWLASRPFVRLWRRMRRAVQRPYWRKSGRAS